VPVEILEILEILDSVGGPLDPQPSQSRVIGGVYTIQQTSSKLPANVFKIRVLMLDVCWTV